MTRRSILEYAEAVRNRYRGASKKEKGTILGEFVRVTGLHRKSAVRLLGGHPTAGPRGRRGRPRRYDLSVADALRTVWEATDRLCSKRLRPFVPEMVTILKREGELRVSPEMEAQLGEMSASTIDRLLHRWRQEGRRRPLSTTRPGTLLKNSIPIRTFAEWEDSQPGFLEVDLVAHCGESGEGFFLNTLCAVDVATSWTECVAVWGKSQERVGGAVHRLRQQLPFPLRGLDSDNGGEFINRHLYDYCRRYGIAFTRSRSYKKNDSCHVEQKNWAVVRRVVGYDRYHTKCAFEALNDLHSVLRLYVNFFQPTMKLLSKSRQGAKVRKTYDEAATPYHRLLRSGVLSEDQRRRLEAVYAGLNPVSLQRQYKEKCERLWALAERPGATQLRTDPGVGQQN